MAGDKKTALVVSAHSADFVWRAGGAIALYASRGWRVKIVCLSFGERGESAKLWKESGMTMEKVKVQRREEALAAAALLGAEVEFLDCGDYPMNFTREHLDRLVDIFRALRPRFRTDPSAGGSVQLRSSRWRRMSSRRPGSWPRRTDTSRRSP